MSINIQQYAGLKSGIYWDVAFAQANTDALALKQTLFLPDDLYYLQNGVTLTCDVASEPNAKLIYNGAGVALTLGSAGAETYDREYQLPQIIRQSPLWHAQSGQAIGTDTALRLLNLKQCAVSFRRIAHFSIGISAEARGSGNGSQDVTVSGRNLWDCGIGYRTLADSGAWVSHHTLRIDKYHLSTILGTRIPGTRHLQLLSPHSGYVVDCANFEGSAAEYILECGAKKLHLRDSYFEGEQHVKLLATAESVLVDGSHYEGVQYESALTISPVVYGNMTKAFAA